MLLLVLLMQLLILVVGYHQHAVGRVQDIGLLALQRKVDELLRQVGNPTAGRVFALVSEAAHRSRYLDVTEFLNVV